MRIAFLLLFIINAAPGKAQSTTTAGQDTPYARVEFRAEPKKIQQYQEELENKPAEERRKWFLRIGFAVIVVSIITTVLVRRRKR